MEILRYVSKCNVKFDKYIVMVTKRNVGILYGTEKVRIIQMQIDL